MIGLIFTIILFNLIAYKNNKNLTSNQVLHIWMFSIAFQQSFDIFVEFKYLGYWYFSKKIEWEGVLPHLFVVPPVNIIFLNWFPFGRSFLKRVFYIFIWVIAILIYEAATILPQPWGYFHYGWWRLWHAAIIDPILFLILLSYYKLVCRLERKAMKGKV